MDNELKTENAVEETAVEASAPQTEATENASQGEQKKKKSFKEKLGGFIFAAVIIVVYIAIAYGDDLKGLGSSGSGNDGSTDAVADYGDNDTDDADDADDAVAPVEPTVSGLNFGVTEGQFVAWFEKTFSTTLRAYDDSDKPIFTSPHSCYFYDIEGETVLLSVLWDDDNKVRHICVGGEYYSSSGTVEAIGKALAPGFNSDDNFKLLTSNDVYTSASLSVLCLQWDLTGNSNTYLIVTENYNKSQQTQ